MEISMTRQKIIRPEFVEFIPDEVEEGVLYVSTRYATATHKCPCGCGEIVVTPIRPTDWTLIWDGDSVTLEPSIGNWSLPCQSHYWIIKNRIVWSRKWGAEKIELGRLTDAKRKPDYFRKFNQSNRGSRRKHK
jgi:hypothetical protein